MTKAMQRREAICREYNKLNKMGIAIGQVYEMLACMNWGTEEEKVYLGITTIRTYLYTNKNRVKGGLRRKKGTK